MTPVTDQALLTYSKNGLSAARAPTVVARIAPAATMLFSLKVLAPVLCGAGGEVRTRASAVQMPRSARLTYPSTLILTNFIANEASIVLDADYAENHEDTLVKRPNKILEPALLTLC